MSSDQPVSFSTLTSPRSWRVTLADGEVREVEAVAFRVEHGALVLVQPVGSVAAYAPGTWRTVEGSAA